MSSGEVSAVVSMGSNETPQNTQYIYIYIFVIVVICGDGGFRYL